MATPARDCSTYIRPFVGGVGATFVQILEDYRAVIQTVSDKQVI
jgi:hypothetical protein